MVLDTCTQILNGDTGTCTQIGITKEWCAAQLQTNAKWTSLQNNVWEQCYLDKWAGGREMKLLAYKLRQWIIVIDLAHRGTNWQIQAYTDRINKSEDLNLKLRRNIQTKIHSRYRSIISMYNQFANSEHRDRRPKNLLDFAKQQVIHGHNRPDGQSGPLSTIFCDFCDDDDATLISDIVQGGDIDLT